MSDLEKIQYVYGIMVAIGVPFVLIMFGYIEMIVHYHLSLFDPLMLILFVLPSFVLLSLGIVAVIDYNRGARR